MTERRTITIEVSDPVVISLIEEGRQPDMRLALRAEPISREDDYLKALKSLGLDDYASVGDLVTDYVEQRDALVALTGCTADKPPSVFAASWLRGRLMRKPSDEDK